MGDDEGCHLGGREQMQEKQMWQLSVLEETRERMECIRPAHL